jgi:tetratricopeptide (TPR) repeat protein
MYRILAGCVFMRLAMAQTDPIADAVQAVHDARSRGSFAEAARRRDAARKLLEQIPASADGYVGWVDSVAALYSTGGRMAEAEAVISRAFKLDPHHRRGLLLFSDFSGGAPVPDSIPDPAAATIRDAREALRAGRTDDAFVLALRALDEEDPAKKAVFSEMPVFASTLAIKQARGMADQLWERLFAMAEARSVDTLLPLLHVTREYARFLAEWPDRTPSARAAIARYRDLLIVAHGPGSGELSAVLRMTIEFEQDHGAPQAAAAAAEELLVLAAAVHGPDGTGNLTYIQTAAGLYEIQGNAQRVRSLYQRAIAIVDTGCAPDDYRPAGVRIQAAFALAHLGDFDDAERLARQAVALDPEFADDLEQVLELRAGAIRERHRRPEVGGPD